MDAYALHLAMAALAGASVVAVSAYFMHRKTLTQILDFARSVERERDKSNGPVDGGGGVVDRNAGFYHRNRSQAHRRRAIYGRGSASLPDVTGAGRDVVDDDKRKRLPNGAAFADDDHKGMGVPPGLPKLHTLREGERQSALSNSVNGATHATKRTSPKSPATCASAFESLDGSDNEDCMENDRKIVGSYLQTRGNTVAFLITLIGYSTIYSFF